MAALDGHTFPPNSLEAIRASLEAGAACIELDITALADGDYLLVHDPDLASETTGLGPVGACTVKQARKLYYKAASAVYHVPLLSDVVAVFQAHPGSTRLQLDFKNVIPVPDDEPLRWLVRLIEPLGSRVIVSTEADWQLRKLRRLAPWLDLGFDIHFYIDWNPHPRNPEAYPRHLGAYGYYDDHPVATRRIWTTADYLKDRCGMLVGLVPNISTFYINHQFLAQSLEDGFNWAEALDEVGILCDAWTLDVGDPAAEANASRLLAAGIDMFSTNTPIALKKFLLPD